MSRTVTGHGGVRLFVRDEGPRDAPVLVLIHGWSQAHMCWERQRPLAERFRVVAFDLRGHGASDKPDDAAAYDNAEPWAGDVAAVLDQLKLTNPVLVGWSMGGRVIADYLSIHGDAAIAGVVTIGTPATGGKYADPEAVRLRSDAVNALGSYSDDPAETIPAIVAFVQECSGHPLSREELATMVGFNMLATPLARRASRVRDYDHRPVWAAMTKPVMLIHGAREKLAVPPAFAQMRGALPGAELHVYEDDGHMAFWESPARFNRDLAAFAERTMGAA